MSQQKKYKLTSVYKKSESEIYFFSTFEEREDFLDYLETKEDFEYAVVETIGKNIIMDALSCIGSSHTGKVDSWGWPIMSEYEEDIYT